MSDIDDFDSPVIFLKGVFVKDLTTTVQDMFYDTLNESIVIAETVKYDKFPRKFTNLESWPKSLNIHCYNCDLTYDTIPIPAGENMKIVGTESHFDVNEVFCSFNCATSYISRVNFKKWERDHNLVVLYQIFKGTPPKVIEDSPSKYKMKKYGGEWTEEFYRETVKDLDDVAG